MRLKIIAGNLVAVLVIGVVSYFVVQTQLESGLSSEVDSEIGNDSTLFGRSFRLSGLTFLEHVKDRARSRPVVDAFGGLDVGSRRTRAHEASNGVAQWFRDPARRGAEPDIVTITDETGQVLARNLDPNQMFEAQLGAELPSLRQVLQDGVARHDIWNKADEEKVLQTGIAPIRSEAGAIIGAIVVGYDLSNGLAESEASILGGDVAFVVEGRVYSSSEDISGGSLNSKLFAAPLLTQTEAALAGNRSTPWQAEIDGDTWIGITAPLPNVQSVPVAYVVMANRSERTELASTANIILILTGLGTILVLVYGFIIGTSFLKPIEQIEEDVLAVINGRTDLRIDVQSAEFGGLAYRINQLINVFTGVAEEDGDGRVSGAPGAPEQGSWQDTAFNTGTGPTGPTPRPASGGGGGGGGAAGVIDDASVASKLAAEPEEQYYARIFQEYVAAKTAAGENVSNIPQDRFIKRLQANAQALAKKHGCREVRFQVEASGKQVSLKPVLIR